MNIRTNVLGNTHTKKLLVHSFPADVNAIGGLHI